MSGESSTEMVVRGLSKTFETRHGSVHALDDISLTVGHNEFISLLGTSGCGKSTLLRIMAGLETPTSGSVTFDGSEVHGPGPDRGMVFQAYTLFPWLSVLDNIAYGLREKGMGREERREVAEHYTQLVGLSGFEDQFTTALSGGMQQRVALARALANDPKALLLDEPFGALDMLTRETMQELLLGIWQRSPKTVVMVTHDVDEAILLANRVVVMSARPGRIREIIDVDLGPERGADVRLSERFLEYKRRATALLRSNEEAGRAA